MIRVGTAVSLALVLTSCRPDSGLRDACASVSVGDAFASARPRLDATGVGHRLTPFGEHLWQKRVGLGAYSCYVNVDAAGVVTRVHFAAGN